MGLIGGIGGGKSAAASLLAARGAIVIDADAVGHEVLRRPEVAARVADRFGADVVGPGGEIDRKALGKVVFADASARRDLEAIVHPPMFEEFERVVAEAERRQEAPLVVLDAAILLESGWDLACDMVVFVDAPRRTRLERVFRNRGWTDEQLSAREAAQWPLEQKKARADAILANDGDVSRLESNVDRLMDRLAPAGSPPTTSRP